MVLYIQINSPLQPLILYTSFDDLNAYSRASGADNPQLTKFSCQPKPLVASFICYEFQKISLKSDFVHIFQDFIRVSPDRADNPLGTKF